VALGDKARIVVTCHRGCTFEEIREAMPAAVRGCLGGRGRHRKPGADPDRAEIEQALGEEWRSPAGLRIRLAALVWQVPPEQAAAKLGYSERTWRRIRSEIPGRDKYR
jgi:hypothetical protein